jgi:hypothetical protein
MPARTSEAEVGSGSEHGIDALFGVCLYFHR